MLVLHTLKSMVDIDQQRNTFATQEDVPFPHWRVWRTAMSLVTDGMTSAKPNVRYDETLQQVAAILRQWAHAWAGQPEMQSLLNKSSLQHEAEESIVALHHLYEWLSGRDDREAPLIVVDACCGKGLFSMLLSYMIGSYWKLETRISRIVMLDKANICWNHIHVANSTAEEEQRPTMEIWEGCNLHHHDVVLDRLQRLETPVAMVGIHLCKTLGPTCIGLVNALGAQWCPFLCLAPCCLPRIATTKKAKTRQIPINIYETQQERQERLEAMQRREGAMQRGQNGVCYLCGEEHRVRDCPRLPAEHEDRVAILKEAAATVPCWKCGIVGHFKAGCPSKLNNPPLLEPPCVMMDVEQVLHSPRPFDAYCRLLADTLQECSTKQLIETGLYNSSSTHQEGNWNGERKSIYIVATR
jgi:Methyltransferase domain/Zinc knuckle